MRKLSFLIVLFSLAFACFRTDAQSGKVIADNGHGVIIIETSPDNYVALTNFNGEATYNKYISSSGTKVGTYLWGETPLQLWDSSIVNTNKLSKSELALLNGVVTHTNAPIKKISKPALPDEDVLQADAQIYRLEQSIRNVSNQKSAITQNESQRRQVGLPPLPSDAGQISQYNYQIRSLQQQLDNARRWDLQVRQFHGLPPSNR